MQVKIGKKKFDIQDCSLFERSQYMTSDTFKKRLDYLTKISKNMFNKKIKVSSKHAGITISIIFEIKEEYGDYIMAIYECNTEKNGTSHNYIGHRNAVHTCKSRNDDMAVILCKDTDPFYTVSATYYNGIETISRNNEKIYLFQTFAAIVLNENSVKK